VLLVTHNVIEAETVLDRVAVLDHGRVIACDTPAGLRALVADEARLDLVWRTEPPLDLPAVAALRPLADVAGRRWTLRLPHARARAAMAELTAGPAYAALDDVTLAAPSLEDVYLALGGRSKGLVKS
jgi:ABC-2 type transport system ATP-binding protein